MFSGDVDFVDLYNQAILTKTRKPVKKKVSPKIAMLAITEREDTDAITAYTSLKQSEGQGVTVSDILAMLNDTSVHNDIYDNPDANYASTSYYVRRDANSVMDKLIALAEWARNNDTTVPLILAQDYFGTIAQFIIDIIDDMNAEKRV